jgi:tetratricopeptide (TPR) repeat protein
MSIIDDTFKRLGDEHIPFEGNAPAHKSATDPMTELGFVVGARKPFPVSFLLALLLAGAGVVVYLWLPKAQPPSAPAKAAIEAPAAVPAPAKPVAEISATPAAQLAAPTVAAPVTTAAVAATPVVVAEEAQGVTPPPQWYAGGWNAADAGKWTDAFAAWENGVRGLPRDRMVVAGNSYADLNAFSAMLKQYVKLFPSVGVRQRHYNGQMVYRLVVFPYGGGTREILPKVQEVFSQASLVNASHLQSRMEETGVVKPAPAAQADAALSGKQAEIPSSAESTAVVSGAAVAREAQPSAPPTAQPSPETTGTAADEANTWESRANAIREQLKAEAYAEVGKSAQELARDFPDRWESWFWLGTAQLAQGQMDAAGTALEHASRLNPGVAQVWVQRAIVAQERGDHAAAVRLLGEARDLSPNSPKIYLNLGYSNDALGLSAEAEKNYRRFLALTEGDEAYALQRKPVINRLEKKP